MKRTYYVLAGKDGDAQSASSPFVEKGDALRLLRRARRIWPAAAFGLVSIDSRGTIRQIGG